VRDAHVVSGELRFEPIELQRGYANRWLRIDVGTNEISLQPVTQQMKDLWTGGKGFDLWLTFKEITMNTKWDSPENPICFSPGPLAGTTSFPGSGKTLVTAVSPLTNTIIDCNVGGYFGPYFKFAGFDALCIVGKAKEDVVILIDAVNKKITIEKAPLEHVDSHIIAEELTEMYADNEMDMRNIAVVSAGKGAEHARMGVLNFSFWDWRRRTVRLKQAGRGGIGTVFRDKKIKAMVMKNRGITPAWRIEENKAAKMVTPKKIAVQTCREDIDAIGKIIQKWNSDPDYLLEMMLDIQQRFRHISKTAIDELNRYTGISKAHLYHCATFYPSMSLEPKGETCIQVCTGGACQAKGAGLVLETLERHLGITVGQTTRDRKYTLEAVSCLGACEQAPVIKIGDRLVGEVSPENIRQILASKAGEPAQEKKADVGIQGLPAAVVMRGPQTAYAGFKKLVESRTQPEAIIDQIKKSGLRGRGGGGFFTGEKWEACRKAAAESNNSAVLVCNSAVIEPPAHAVIEGMLICALGVGAAQGYVCFRHEHKEAFERFEHAVNEARKKGLLGAKIPGTDLCFDIKLHRGAGGFVIGESSALLQSISGNVGEPQAKYIHSTEAGYKGKPTVVSNIETWANIPLIMEKGAGWFKKLGSGSGGSKMLLLSGDVKKSGIVEVAMGTTLREIVDNLGQGIAKKKRSVKAIQAGGPSGGFIPASMLDCKIDYESLHEAGSIMGSGSVVVKDNRKCIVDAARYSVEFLLNESCGKCTPCREGLYALHTTLDRICGGKGKKADIEFMREIAQTMKDTSLCQFGKTAASPVLSMISYFQNELEEHIQEKKCRCGVCKAMASFVINAQKCTGCTLCAKKCSAEAISGKKKEAHVIDPKKCISCGVCYDVCTFDAVEVK